MLHTVEREGSDAAGLEAHIASQPTPIADCYEEAATLAISYAIQQRKARAFFDIVADDGDFSRLATACGVDNVHAFDARPSSLNALRSIDERVTVHAAALSDHHKGEMTVWWTGAQIFERKPTLQQRLSLAFRRKFRIHEARATLTSIDHFVSAGGIVPDVIKIDVDGYEGKVLRGGSRTFENHKPTIALELHQNTKLVFGDTRPGIVAMLTDIGYKALFLTDHHDRGACRIVEVSADHPLVARQETDFLLFV